MKTKLFIGALAVMASVLVASPASAQENGNRDENGKVVRGPYETNRFGDNWFVGAGAGVNSFVTKRGASPKFGVAVDVNFGKWITPTIGGRLGWKGINDKVGVKDGYSVVDEKFSYNIVHADLLWNVSNAFGGYKETRTWNVILYPSVSFIHASGDNELGAGAGMLNNFRLCDRVNLFVDLSVMGTKAGISRVEPLPSRFGFVPSASVGVSVNLGKTGFKRHSSVVPAVIPVPFTEAQYNELKDRVQVLEKENKDLKAKIEELKNAKPDTVTVSKAGDLVSPATLYFEIGNTELSEREKAHLEFYVKNILEQAPEKVFVLTGSADKTTGTAKRNQYLSEQRVNNVKKLLVEKYGIAEDHLVVKAEGSSNNRFGSAVLNRVVTIE